VCVGVVEGMKAASRTEAPLQVDTPPGGKLAPTKMACQGHGQLPGGAKMACSGREKAERPTSLSGGGSDHFAPVFVQCLTDSVGWS